MISIIENDIINKLKEKFAEYEIDGFPVNFDKYSFTSPKGCLLLRYNGHENAVQSTLWAVNTNKKYDFTLYAGIRYAQKHTDCYKFLDEVEKVLNGLTIINKRMCVSGCKFKAETNGDLWYTYDLTISLHLNDIYEDLSESNEILA